MNKIVEFIVNIFINIAEIINKYIKIFEIIAIIFCASPIVIAIIERIIK
ncbi:MAG: hypothetical protein V8R81_01745 [Clostridia bacterium]